MNIAIVHDWLSETAGAEKVVLNMLKVFPNADVYTSIYNKEKAKEFAKFNVKTTYLQKLPLAQKLRSTMIPLMPMAFEQFSMKKYDIVISSSTSAAKGIITNPETCHINYCNTPTRYLWQPSLDKRASDSWLKRKVNHSLRIWDMVASVRPDYFIANSENVRNRIKKYYRRDAVVINPPVDVEFYNFSDERERDDYFVFVGRLVPYKKADIVIEAFNKLGKKLVVVGSGSQENELKRMAKENIKFAGRASDEEMKKLIIRAQAVIFPSEEDFGIVPVEAFAAGTPVIAFGKGGALETVTAGKTGEFFADQTADSIVQVVKNFDSKKYSVKTLVDESKKFSEEKFQRNFKDFVLKSYESYQKEIPLN